MKDTRVNSQQVDCVNAHERSMSPRAVALFCLAVVSSYLVFAFNAVSVDAAEKFIHEIVAEGSGTVEGQFGIRGGAQDVAVNRASAVDGTTGL